jgi:hypothetical protein
MKEPLAVVAGSMIRHLTSEVLEVNVGQTDCGIRFHRQCLLHTCDIRFILNAVINFWAGLYRQPNRHDISIMDSSDAVAE